MDTNLVNQKVSVEFDSSIEDTSVPIMAPSIVVVIYKLTIATTLNFII